MHGLVRLLKTPLFGEAAVDRSLVGHVRSLISRRFVKATGWLWAGLIVVGTLGQQGVAAAVTGLLGASAVGLAYYGMTRRRAIPASREQEGATERLIRLGDELDACRFWSRDGGAAVVLSLPPVIFWATTIGYLEAFGPGSELAWLGATLVSSVPPILLAARAVTSFLARRSVLVELAQLRITGNLMDQ